MSGGASNRVQAYYDAQAQAEWARLERHRMEWHTTWQATVEFIPVRSRILDAGGGPGRYSIALAGTGHRVTLLDLSSESVALARRKAQELGVVLEDAVQGDAKDLSRFVDAAFDVVLLMGPLYHLTAGRDREQALSEALRVLRPGGVLFASFITRYAFLVDMLKRDPGEIVSADLPLLKRGVHIPSAEHPGFTDSYFARPAEIEPLMAAHGLRRLRLAASEPLVCLVEGAVNAAPVDAFEKWASLCYRLGEDPATWGATEHMLFVGLKG
jgi:SAM-dependent methyltransferase